MDSETSSRLVSSRSVLLHNSDPLDANKLDLQVYSKCVPPSSVSHFPWHVRSSTEWVKGAAVLYANAVYHISIFRYSLVS